MSSSSSLFSYDKYSLLKGIIYGVIIFVLFFVASYGSFKFFTLNKVLEKSEEYVAKLSDETKTQKDLMEEFLEYVPVKLLIDDEKLRENIKTGKIDIFKEGGKRYRLKPSLRFVLDVMRHLNFASLWDFFSKNKDKSFFSKDLNYSKSINFNTIREELKLKLPIKIYIVLLSVGTIFTLLRLTVNYTFTTIIAKTIDSDNDVSPFGQTKFKPETSYFDEFINMVMLFILNVFIGISPIVFIWIFNFIPTFYLNIPKNYKNVWGICLLVGTLALMIGVLFYFYANLFSSGLNVTADAGTLSSNESKSKGFLQTFFNQQDYEFVNKIFSFKNTLTGSLGVWLFVFIMFFIFETATVFKKKKYLGFKSRITKLVIITLVLIAYSFFIAYRNYGDDDDVNNVFNDDNTLTKNMYKNNVNNIFQALVKYNYPCMPFSS